MRTHELTGPVHFSELKSMAMSPAHYRLAVERPRPPTAAMQLGSAVHALVLGGDVYESATDRRGAAYKTMRAELGPDAIIITPPEAVEAHAIADSVLADPVARPWLDGEHELDLSWKIGPRACGGRLDVLGATFVADLKSTRCSKPDWFAREAIRRHYHAQLAWYSLGARCAGRDVRDAVLVAVESSPPYAVTVHRLTERALALGERAARGWFERLLVCEASGAWQAYAQSVLDLDVPEDLEITFGGEEEP